MAYLSAVQRAAKTVKIVSLGRVKAIEPPEKWGKETEPPRGEMEVGFDETANRRI